jgi:hypothetical protein
MANGFFGNAFDLNGDGNLDVLEQAFETAFVMDMIESCESDDTDFDSTDF